MIYRCPHCFGKKGFLRKPQRVDDWPEWKPCVICGERGHLTTDDFAKLAKVSRSTIRCIELAGTSKDRPSSSRFGGSRVGKKVLDAIFGMAERERLQVEAREARGLPT